MKRGIIAALVASLAAACAHRSAAPLALQSHPDIDGIVRYQCGVAVPYATVTLRGSGNMYISTLTDNKGHYQFSASPAANAGTYAGQIAKAIRTVPESGPTTWRMSSTVSLRVDANHGHGDTLTFGDAGAPSAAAPTCDATQNGELRGSVAHGRSPWDHSPFSINVLGCGNVVAMATNADGSFVIKQLLAGSYQVIVLSGNSELTAVTNHVEILPNQTTTLVQTLRWWPVPQ